MSVVSFVPQNADKNQCCQLIGISTICDNTFKSKQVNI